jgi:FkbM family methyltransferase
MNKFGRLNNSIIKIANRSKNYTLFSLLEYVIDFVGFHLPHIKKIAIPFSFSYRLRNGIVITLRPFKHDRCIVDEIFLEQAYTPSKAFSFKSSDVVLDVGAHIGIFTLFAASRGDDITVYSYEPRPDNFRLLNKNVRQNCLLNRVKIFNCAVSASKGSLQFSLDDLGMGKINGGGEHVLTVHTVGLKDIFEENSIDRVNFLKMDIEGEELVAILNLPTSFLSRIDKISMECHSQKITTELSRYLSNHNFTVSVEMLPHPDLFMLFAINKTSIETVVNN